MIFKVYVFNPISNEVEEHLMYAESFNDLISTKANIIYAKELVGIDEINEFNSKRERYMR